MTLTARQAKVRMTYTNAVQQFLKCDAAGDKPQAAIWSGQISAITEIFGCQLTAEWHAAEVAAFKANHN